MFGATRYQRVILQVPTTSGLSATTGYNVTRFVLWMLLASALGFIKILALAYLMPVKEYGLYVVYFGIATFASMLLSFGLTEKTIKDYPRRYVSGLKKAVLTDAIRIVKVTFIRYAIVGIALMVIPYHGLLPVTYLAIIYITALAICTAVLAIVGSLYRAAGSQNALLNFNLWRYSLVIFFALPAGLLLGWQGAICGDIVGNILSICIATRQLPLLYKNENTNPSTGSQENTNDAGHYKLYLANLLVASQTMLDKVLINAASGSMGAGAYSVVMLIPQSIQLLSNVIAQYIGPLAIKIAHLKKMHADPRHGVKFNALVLASFSILLVLSSILAKRLPYLEYIFNKYEVSDASLFLVGLIACGQVYGLLEYRLIAINREQDVLVASIASFIVFVFTFAGVAFLQARIEWFLLSMCAARWTQVWVLRKAYHRHE